MYKTMFNKSRRINLFNALISRKIIFWLRCFIERDAKLSRERMIPGLRGIFGSFVLRTCNFKTSWKAAQRLKNLPVINIPWREIPSARVSASVITQEASYRVVSTLAHRKTSRELFFHSNLYKGKREETERGRETERERERKRERERERGLRELERIIWWRLQLRLYSSR